MHDTSYELKSKSELARRMHANGQRNLQVPGAQLSNMRLER